LYEDEDRDRAEAAPPRRRAAFRAAEAGVLLLLLLRTRKEAEDRRRSMRAREPRRRQQRACLDRKDTLMRLFFLAKKSRGLWGCVVCRWTWKDEHSDAASQRGIERFGIQYSHCEEAGSAMVRKACECSHLTTTHRHLFLLLPCPALVPSTARGAREAHALSYWNTQNPLRWRSRLPRRDVLMTFFANLEPYLMPLFSRAFDPFLVSSLPHHLDQTAVHLLRSSGGD